MEVTQPINLFYEEPAPDRWIVFDRYPRRIIRRVIRGKQRPGGVMMIALNLIKGLEKLGHPYRFNDYKYIRSHPDEIACIIGKPHILFDRKWKNPVVLGAGVYSHPVDCPDLFERYPNVKRFLVPGPWMCKMFEPVYGDKVTAWPTGIDTDTWKPTVVDKKFDFVIYDKIRWHHDKFQTELIKPLTEVLESLDLSYQFIRYGNYGHTELMSKLAESRSVLFLCEHETQGLAYQQMLSTNTPILAWDRGGFWQDPAYYPQIKYAPVSSVPYWDERCGMKFTGLADFKAKLLEFQSKLVHFEPRNFILEDLTLEKCAEKYIDIISEINTELQRPTP